MTLKKILIIQTAFIGDVVLATALIEKFASGHPGIAIDFLLRKGNENLLLDDPRLNQVLIWDKKGSKFKNLLRLAKKVRKERYDLVVNLQRFLSTGLLASVSGARVIIGYKKNPLSFLFHRNYEHQIGDGTHEVDRNQRLIAAFTDEKGGRPSLHLPKKAISKVARLKDGEYICIAPTSVWFTKQFPREKWVEFLTQTAFKGTTYLLGGPADFQACEEIRTQAGIDAIRNLCGELSLIESAALMKDAKMNFVNDSAPQHFASAVNAPVTTIFCSTVPSFGFGPLSDNAAVIETEEDLSCRPCGLHGHKQCPERHFKCALTIDLKHLERRLA